MGGAKETPGGCRRGLKALEEKTPRGGNVSRQADDIQYPETRNQKNG